MADTASTFIWNSDALLSSMVGALIGGSMALAGVYISHQLSKRDAAEKEAMHSTGVLQAIHDEMGTLWETYLLTAGNTLESLQENMPFHMYWPVNQDYFTIYKTNALFIGKIKNHDLRKQIISTYIEAKSLIDSFTLNNTLVQKREDAYHLFLETSDATHQAKADAYYQVVVEYTVLLKKGHLMLKDKVSELLYLLRKEGVLTPDGSTTHN